MDKKPKSDESVELVNIQLNIHHIHASPWRVSLLAMTHQLIYDLSQSHVCSCKNLNTPFNMYM